MVHCSCAFDVPWSTSRCSCSANKSPCNLFCASNDGNCYNIWSVNENDTCDSNVDDNDEKQGDGDAEED